MRTTFKDNGMTPYWVKKVQKINKLCPICGKSVPILVRGRYHPQCKEAAKKANAFKRKLKRIDVKKL